MNNERCVSLNGLLKEQNVFVVAELAGNHGGSFDKALRMVEEAAKAGANAIKLQTFSPGGITMDSDRPEFKLPTGATLYEVYEAFQTPWEWQPKLKVAAEERGMACFSSPFDPSAVDFLVAMDVPAIKIASFELVDIQLIRKAASTGKPLILSTGMASLSEIDEAVTAAREAGCLDMILLKCTSSYPATPEEMNLRTIPHLSEAFGLPVGLSDHSKGIAIPVAAVVLGACLIEKHLTLLRADGGPESTFALEPSEFKAMVGAVREAELGLGVVHYGLTDQEVASRNYRRSLFVVKDVRQGEVFTGANVQSIRPAHGLPPRELERVLGREASRDIPAGTPLSWELVQ